MLHMTPWLRRVSTALALAVALAVGTVAPPHADGLDDLACAAALAAHDEGAHSLRPAAVRAHQDGQHCVLCHSLRTFSPAADPYEQGFGGVSREGFSLSRTAPAHRLSWTSIAGRAPPA